MYISPIHDEDFQLSHVNTVHMNEETDTRHPIKLSPGW